MKKLFIIFIFILIIGCSRGAVEELEAELISDPVTLFDKLVINSKSGNTNIKYTDGESYIKLYGLPYIESYNIDGRIVEKNLNGEELINIIATYSSGVSNTVIIYDIFKDRVNFRYILSVKVDGKEYGDSFEGYIQTIKGSDRIEWSSNTTSQDSILLMNDIMSTLENYLDVNFEDWGYKNYYKVVANEIILINNEKIKESAEKEKDYDEEVSHNNELFDDYNSLLSYIEINIATNYAESHINEDILRIIENSKIDMGDSDTGADMLNIYISIRDSIHAVDEGDYSNQLNIIFDLIYQFRTNYLDIHSVG